LRRSRSAATARLHIRSGVLLCTVTLCRNDGSRRVFAIDREIYRRGYHDDQGCGNAGADYDFTLGGVQKALLLLAHDQFL
jgi:hypothetical protein